MRIKKEKKNNFLFLFKFMVQISSGLCIFSFYQTSHAVGCSISPASLDFGQVSTSAVLASTNVTVTCDPIDNGRTNFAVCLATNSDTPRYLYKGTENLRYDLFYDAARTQVIKSSNQTDSLQCWSVSATGNQPIITQIPVYGLVYSGQQPGMGQYMSSGLSFELLYAAGRANDYPKKTSVLTSGQMASNSAVVSANYANGCVLHSATDLDFGSFDNLNTNRTASAFITLQCPNNTAWKVGLDQGQYALATGQRRMWNGRDYINYELYSDAAYSQVWGSTLDSMVQGSGTYLLQTISVYGKVPVQSFQSPGDYQDTITVTLTY